MIAVYSYIKDFNRKMINFELWERKNVPTVGIGPNGQRM